MSLLMPVHTRRDGKSLSWTSTSQFSQPSRFKTQKTFINPWVKLFSECHVAYSCSLMSIHAALDKVSQAVIIFPSGSSFSALTSRGFGLSITDFISVWLSRLHAAILTRVIFKGALLKWQWERKQPPPPLPPFCYEKRRGDWPWARASQWMFVQTHKAKAVSSFESG